MSNKNGTPNASKAIEILAELLQKTKVSNLAYLVTPNTVLTLSGARGYCDGVYYHENDDKDTLKYWVDEISETIEILKGITDIVLSESLVSTTVSNEPCASYEIVFDEGLEHTLEETMLLGSVEKSDLLEKSSMKKLMNKLENLLKSSKEFENLSKDNINYMAFGILLGYPDSAITETYDRWEVGPFDERLVDANIRGANYYICPQPVYSYPRHLINDSKIRAHEELWSKILFDFYNSEFHKLLTKDSSFSAKLKELRMIE